MKKKKIFVLLIALMMSFTIKVEASTCSSARVMELSSLANNVNVSYEKYDKKVESFVSELDDEEVEYTYPAFYITIYNLPDELNVAATMNETKETIHVKSSDKEADGVIYIDTGEASSIKNFTIKIRSNDSNCLNEVYRSINITTPMFNSFSQTEACHDNPDFNLCQEFSNVDYSNVSIRTFNESIEKYNTQVNEEKNQKTVKNVIWIVLALVIVVLIGGIVFLLIRRKRSDLA
ncbi:MAG: hypothetical protein IJ572_00660 [Bacilli bacterium]|nr:hypothetical protein [Bacilli bacterium]